MSSRFRSRVVWLSCSALLTYLGSAVNAQTTAAASSPARHALVTQPIDATRLHALAGNTRPEANAQNDQGKVADSFLLDHMILQLQRSAAQEQTLKTFIDQQHDSTSPNFHKWLTAEQFGSLYGTAPEDIAKVTKWLEASGFTVNTVYPSGMTLDFSGTAGQVLAAFHTEIHKLSVNGQSHIANMADPQIPEALAPVIAGVVSMHDFRPRAMKKKRSQYSGTQDGSPFQIVTPADLATIYDFNAAYSAGYTGQGQTIAVIEDSDLYNTRDWSTFRSTFGLSGYTSGTLTTSHPAPATGRNNCSDPGISTGDDSEATLDAEWASASAPNAAIIVATCNDTTASFGGDIAFLNLISASTHPQIISYSYGSCEAFNTAAANAATNSAYQQAVSEGISVFVSAGDEGAASCDGGTSSATHGIAVSGTASTPYNVAVGGTDFSDTLNGTNNTYWSSTNSATYGSALSYIPEIPWNGSCASALLAKSYGYNTSYGPNGFCGSEIAINSGLVEVAAAGGGPSACATGTPSANGIVGGTCQGYAKPSWQAGLTGIPNDGVRDLPDVSLFASNGIWQHAYVYCYSNLNNEGATCTGAPVNWNLAGGTSFAAPIMAGIQALINQKMGGSQGNPNPVYYKLAASTVASSVFHQVTQGDITVNCSGEINCYGIGFEGRGRAGLPTVFDGNGALSTSSSSYSPAFSASAGWSFGAGLGSVDVFNLITNWTKGQ